LILKVNGHAVSTVPELLSRVAALKPGEQAALLIQRQQTETTLTVVPGKRNPVKLRQ
jgi:serine protease DegQ